MQTYTVRMGLIDTKLWNQHGIVDLYKMELSKLGFKTSQLPSVAWPKTKTQLKANSPFEGGRTIQISIPVFGEFEQTRDTRVPYSSDPAALAETGLAYASVFTWNLCAPEGMQDAAGKLREVFRKMRPEGGMKLSPKVTKYSETPLVLTGYPNLPFDPCQDPLIVKKNIPDKQGLWTLLVGIGLSIISKGKV